MTDIVERLRETGDANHPHSALLWNAADEIERLRHELRAEAIAREIHMREIERLRIAAKPFAEHDWYDAELEDNNCRLVKHSGPVTVGHWRALRTALGMKP